MRVISGMCGDVYLIKTPIEEVDNVTSFYVTRCRSEECSELLIHRPSPVEVSNIHLFPLSEGRFCVWSKGDSSLLLAEYTETAINVMEIELSVKPTSLFVNDGLDGESRIKEGGR